MPACFLREREFALHDAKVLDARGWLLQQLWSIAYGRASKLDTHIIISVVISPLPRLRWRILWLLHLLQYCVFVKVTEESSVQT